jgi:cytochrome c biogenesis protein CcmG, thiol:disulfide interchange protein DsbE
VGQAEPELAAETSRRWIRLVLLAVLVVAVVVVALRPTDVPAFRASGEPVDLPPPGELTTVSADEFEGMLVGLLGTPVIVNIWASWCTPCRSEAPLLARAARQHDDVVIIGVASKDNVESARRFMDEFDMDYVNVFDVSGAIRSRLDLRGFPTTYVFDGDGELVSTVIGGITERALAGAIESVT